MSHPSPYSRTHMNVISDPENDRRNFGLNRWSEAFAELPRLAPFSDPADSADCISVISAIAYQPPGRQAFCLRRALVLPRPSRLGPLSETHENIGIFAIHHAPSSLWEAAGKPLAPNTTPRLSFLMRLATGFAARQIAQRCLRCGSL